MNRTGNLPKFLTTCFAAAAITIGTAAHAQDGWTELASENNITISAQLQECGGASFYVVRIENSGETPLNVGYTLTLADAPVIPPISDSRIVDGGASVEGECGNAGNTLTVMTFPTANTIEKLTATLSVSE
ncbi:MAG: hypothetical protein KDD36_03725 [Flavobacteriales bacterium]|nr:hypothetical protein [Flavobacteriales bacterium]